MTTPASVLRKAKELIETDGWAQGREVFGSSRRCAGVAIIATGRGMDDGQYEARQRARTVFRIAIGTMDIVGWNDAPERTVDDVYDAFRKAILLAEQEESRK